MVDPRTCEAVPLDLVELMVELDSEKPGVESLQLMYTRAVAIKVVVQVPRSKGGFMVDYGIGLGGAGPVLVQGGAKVDWFDPRWRLLIMVDLVELMVELDSEKPGVESLQLMYTRAVAIKVVVQVPRSKSGFMMDYGIGLGGAGPVLVQELNMGIQVGESLHIVTRPFKIKPHTCGSKVFKLGTVSLLCARTDGPGWCSGPDPSAGGHNTFLRQSHVVHWASITPGTVLKTLAGKFKGKRVVFLKQLTSGLFLVTGPFKINGVPLRWLNQSFMIANSTKVDLSGLNVDKFDDMYFAKQVEKKKKKGEGEF
ncbi:hypothetical protein LguiA_009186 [Lonicera macranthoides]